MKVIALNAVLIIFFVLSAFNARASHIFGADFSYTWVSGNTYTLTLVVYGDCNIAPGASFLSLQGATPGIDIYNGTTKLSSILLTQQGTGDEVTPVCALQAAATSCSLVGSTIPGVKRYTYAVNYTLPTTSANWRFRFEGYLGSSIAGRSASITNIFNNPQTDIMALEATLNNTGGHNSNPVYTTIPTPFFCINKAANYNPGTVDADGDSLVFNLVTGLNGSGTFSPPFPSTGIVTYLNGATATAPLTTAPGSFSFSSTSGQLSFTPNAVQRSLVVSQVAEYRNGVLVGTSMREMTFVVLASCNNSAPTGNITNSTSGTTVANTTTINACTALGAISFSINPTDPDGDNINIVSNGIPSGASFTIANNNTTAPLGSFSWNIANVAPGTYNFFITYTDDGCPLSSKQTIAYTIVVSPNPVMGFNLISAATCTKKAVFTLTPNIGATPYSITRNNQTLTGITGPVTDSLAPGTYTFTTTNANGCSHDTTITIVSPSSIGIGISLKKSICSNLANGAATLTGLNGIAPYTFSQGTGAYGSTSIYTPLASGTYTFHVKDAGGCIKDTTVAVTDSLHLSDAISVSNIACNGQSTGSISANGAGGQVPYTYAIGTGSFTVSNVFTNLAAGTYAIHLLDANGCTNDTSALLSQPTTVIPAVTIQNVSCNSLNNGAVTIAASGGTPGYTYASGSGAYGTSNTFNGFFAGSYTVHIKDANGCVKDTSFVITQPLPLAFQLAVTNVLCHGDNTGTVNALNVSGGTAPYTYAVDGGTFGSAGLIGSLTAGTHVFHLKDAHNCTKDSSFTIAQLSSLGLTYTATTPTCDYNTDATLTILGTGGAPPYQYALNSSSFGANGAYTGLAAGNYTLHVKDGNNCTMDSLIAIAPSPSIYINALLVQRPHCNVFADGAITIIASSIAPTFTYALNSGAYSASSTIANLASGIDTIHVKDGRGCIKDSVYTLTDSVVVAATIVTTLPLCNGQSNGLITINPSGGLAPYTYAADIAAFSSTNPITNMAAGVHALHIKDVYGCKLDTSVLMNEPSVITPGAIVTNPSCTGTTDIIVQLSASGGTPSYTYAVGNSPFIASGTYAIVPGTYVFHIKDANGCTKDTILALPGYQRMTINTPILRNVSCYNGTDGAITLNVSGGLQPLTYELQIPATTNNSGVFGGLGAGAYTFTIVDSKGCVRDTGYSLSQPAAIVATTSITPNDCVGEDNTGSAKVTVSGGVGPYSYLWSNGQSGTDIYALANGNYIVQVTDNHNCVDTAIAAVIYDDCCKPFIPSGFTPNGDGNNDVFRVRYKGDVIKMELSVYNRFGQRIFIGNNPDAAWDGTFNGVPQDIGTYFYYIKFDCGNKGDHPVSFKGEITLIR